MKEITYYNRYGDSYFEDCHLFMFPKQMRLLRSICATRTDFREGDRLFFSNHVSYPRFKFRDWARSQGIGIAKKPSNSNVFLLDIEYLNKILDKLKYRTVKMRKEWVTLWPIILHNSPTTISNEMIYRAIDSDDTPLSKNSVMVELYNTRLLYKKDIQAFEQATILYNYKVAHPEVEIMDYPVFSKLVSTDLIMDKEMFEDTYHMLDSSDNETRDLAVEILTNVNISKSQFFVDLLLHTRGSSIMNSNVYNKVTFKPVKYYIEKGYEGPSYTNRQLDNERHLSLILDSISRNYRRKNIAHKMNYPYIREILYPQVMKKLENSISMKGIKITSAIFDLDPVMFPEQMKGYKYQKAKSRPLATDSVSLAGYAEEE